MSEEDRRIADAEFKGRVLEALNRINDSIEALRQDHKYRLDNHADRLRSLENSRSWVMGASAAFGAVSGWIASKIGGHP